MAKAPGVTRIVSVSVAFASPCRAWDQSHGATVHGPLHVNVGHAGAGLRGPRGAMGTGSHGGIFLVRRYKKSPFFIFPLPGRSFACVAGHLGTGLVTAFTRPGKDRAPGGTALYDSECLLRAVPESGSMGPRLGRI